jgi:hypothetical protein
MNGSLSKTIHASESANRKSAGRIRRRKAEMRSPANGVCQPDPADARRAR